MRIRLPLFGLILILTMFTSIRIAHSQGKISVGVIALSKVGNQLNDHIQNKLEALAVDVLDKGCRFDLVAISHLFVVDDELTRQRGEEYIRSEIVRQGERLAVKYIAYAYMTSVIVTPQNDNNARTNEAKVEYSLNYVEVKTGKLVHSNPIKGSDKDSNPTEAINKAIQNTQTSIEDWVNSHFSFEGEVLKIEKENGRYKIYAAISRKCNLDPNYLYVKYKENAYISHTLGVLDVDKVDNLVLIGYLKDSEYKKNANKAKLAKSLDTLWEENKTQTIIGDRQ